MKTVVSAQYLVVRTPARPEAGVRRPGSGGWAAGLAVTVAFLACVDSLPAEPLRLDAATATARAIEMSNLVAAARERTEAATAGVQAADAARWPSLAASASLSRRSSVPEFRLPITLPGQPTVVLMPDITTTYGTGLRASQTLLAGGAIEAQRRATRFDQAAASARQSQAASDLRLAAQAAYWEAVRARASLEVTAAQAARSDRLLADSQDLLRAGMAVRADVLAAQERQASGTVALIRARAASATALDTLRSLLQLAPEQDIELADTLMGTLPGVPPPLAEIQADAVSTRAELGAASAQLAALHARETLTRAPLRPALQAVAQWDLARPNQRYFPTADEWHDSWAVSLVGTWTLFDGGRSGAERAVSQAQQRALTRERAELERRTRLDVLTARRELETALQTVEAADLARQAALARQEAARDRHAAGLAAMVEVLDAEAQLTAAEQQQVNARAGAWMAAASLDRAVGR
ncbi:MAG TPA: TolC family protein [Thermoanaerobaculaceae bacterium]|nr:TolC family protein [Thermoanaerobaculaceae bacterium]HPS78727.1 TolC family protein [Thermoanaerobaculaceae bacterium]